MDGYDLYSNLLSRTDGEIYIGIVGPVRTGKSTFVRRFMEVFGLPHIDETRRQEIKDQLPVSGSGNTITTVEPKFTPNQAVDITLREGLCAKIRLIDCVGFLIPDASGDREGDRERMVKSPFVNHEIPFRQAAEIGTQRVIEDHASFGIVMTTDGSFGPIERDGFVAAEERTVAELKHTGKPFVIVINTTKAHGEETRKLVKDLEQKYHAACLPMNCDQMNEHDVEQLFMSMLYQYPITEIDYDFPKWLDTVEMNSPIKQSLVQAVKKVADQCHTMAEVTQETVCPDSEYIKTCFLEKADLATGVLSVKIDMDSGYYYSLLSELTGLSIRDEYQLIQTIKAMSDSRQMYEEVGQAMTMVRENGYGVVRPTKNEVELDAPTVIRQGSKYGVRIVAHSPSIHFIKADVETEIAPIVGTEEQAQDLIRYIEETREKEGDIWRTSIFGKSIEQLVDDGIRNKLAQISTESQIRLQNTMQKIVNDGRGGMVCIII